MSNYDIFISYRRDGGADFARQMQLALSAKGYSVFLDFDALKDGVFDRRIESAIKSSKVFLFVLSPHSLDRCCNENDWVRREIECALISKCHIVPVSPNVTFEGFDDIEGLPYFIKNGLGQHQVSTVMMNDLFECTFEEFVRKRIANVVSPHQQALKDEVKEGCEVHIETDIPCYVFRFKEQLITAQPNDDNLIYLKKGSHKLTFVSTDNENDSYSLVYAVKDDCEFLQVSLAKIRDARVAAEEAERRAKEERKLIAEDDAKYQLYEENDLYGFKKDGAVVIPAKYDNADDFSEGLAAVEINGKWGCIDKSGREVIPLKYDNVRWFSEGLARVEFGGKWGYIDKSGKEVIPLQYDDAYIFSEGLAAVELNGKLGYIDKSGKEVIQLKYDNADEFSEGLAAVKLNGKWGYINKSGKEVIPLKYDSAYRFSNGQARAKLNGEWGYIDKQGNFNPNK